jgi:hypothetical protein
MTWVTLLTPKYEPFFVAGVLPPQLGAVAGQCDHDLGHPSAPLCGALTELCSHNLGHPSAPVAGVLPVQPGALARQCVVVSWVTLLPPIYELCLLQVLIWAVWSSGVMTWVTRVSPYYVDR